MDPVLVSALIQLAQNSPAIIADVRAIFHKGGATDAQKALAESIWVKDPESYFGPTPTVVDEAPPVAPVVTQQEPYYLLTRTIPKKLTPTDRIFKLSYGGEVVFTLIAAGKFVMAGAKECDEQGNLIAAEVVDGAPI